MQDDQITPQTAVLILAMAGHLNPSCGKSHAALFNTPMADTVK